MQTHDKEREAERTMIERKAMEADDKELQIKIHNIKGEIEK